MKFKFEYFLNYFKFKNCTIALIQYKLKVFKNDTTFKSIV